MGIWGKIAALLMVFSTPALSQTSTMKPVPPEYRGPAIVIVDFKDNFWEVEAACMDYNPGWITYACHFGDKHLIISPNPCYYPEAADIRSYAYLMCHEKAHENGWDH